MVAGMPARFPGRLFGKAATVRIAVARMEGHAERKNGPSALAIAIQAAPPGRPRPRQPAGAGLPAFLPKPGGPPPVGAPMPTRARPTGKESGHRPHAWRQRPREHPWAASAGPSSCARIPANLKPRAAQTQVTQIMLSKWVKSMARRLRKSRLGAEPTYGFACRFLTDGTHAPA